MKLYAIAATFMLSTALAAPTFAQEAGPCKEFYTTVSSEAEKILHDKDGSVEDKQAKLAVLFDKTLDTNWIGKFVIGRYWKDASPDQQKEYLKDYNLYLKKIYISKFNGDDLANLTIKLVSMTPLRSGDFDTRTVILRPGQPDVHVNYVLNEAGNQCHVHDISIENVSLLSSQRSEFQAIAGRSGVAGVIDAIKSKLGQ